MWGNISKLVAAVILVALVAGCPSKNPSPSTSNVEELRLLTPEQERTLFENAERVEKKEVVSYPLKNDAGEVVGTVTSQTTVIFLRPSAGGGKFDVNITCSGGCTGNPTILCSNKGVDENKCKCRPKDRNCVCEGCQDSGGCTEGSGGCKKSSVGFGNFGVFIAMDGDNPPNTSVASK